MKKLLYASYTNINRDGRSIILLKNLSKYYDVIIHNKPYPTLKLLKSILNAEIIFIDNRKILVVLFPLFLLFKNKTIVKDVRELYTLKESKSISNYIGTLFEGFFIRKANIIIVANRWRARLTKLYWQLDKTPFVIENRRGFEKIENGEYYNEKLDLFDIATQGFIELDKTKLNIIISNGFSRERNNKILLDKIKDFRDFIDLYFIGKCYGNDLDYIQNYIKINKLTNVFCLAPVDIHKLRCIINMMDVGLVYYSKTNLNNRYCASGKIYEFLSLNKPVITSSQIPLHQIVERHKVGCSYADFSESLNEFLKHYETFKNNAFHFNQKQYIHKYNTDTFFELNKLINEVK